MKLLKQVDLFIQLLLMVTLIVFIVASEEGFKLNVLAALFVIGVYQLISMLAHEVSRYFIKRGSVRRMYHNISYIIAALSLFYNQLPGVIYLIVSITPFMAFFYTWLCYKETYVYLKRPLSILK